MDHPFLPLHFLRHIPHNQAVTLIVSTSCFWHSSCNLFSYKSCPRIDGHELAAMRKEINCHANRNNVATCVNQLPQKILATIDGPCLTNNTRLNEREGAMRRFIGLVIALVMLASIGGCYFGWDNDGRGGRGGDRGGDHDHDRDQRHFQGR